MFSFLRGPSEAETLDRLCHQEVCGRCLTEGEKKRLHALQRKNGLFRLNKRGRDYFSTYDRLNQIRNTQEEIIGRMVRREAAPADKSRLDRLGEEHFARLNPRAHRILRLKEQRRALHAQAFRR